MREQPANLDQDRTSQAVDRDQIIEMAKRLYQQRLNEGWNMSDGPCLADELIPDWCVDVAHDPRQPVDDLPRNQCPSYRSGRTHHVVELDPQGNLIRAQ